MEYKIIDKYNSYKNQQLIYFQTPLYEDERGAFGVSFDNEFSLKIVDKKFIQSNYSINKENVSRGMHFQIENTQAKLVRCISGNITDIVLDLRINSPHFGKIILFPLNKPNLFLYIPEGFAHGFITHENNSIFEYFVSDIWNKSAERSFSLDNVLSIIHKVNFNVISEKDKNPTYTDLNDLFLYTELKNNKFFNL